MGQPTKPDANNSAAAKSAPSSKDVCPKCAQPSKDFFDVDVGLKLILQKDLGLTSLPDKVCPNCYNELTSRVSEGVKLRLERQVKEKNRHLIWKSRVNLVKQARTMMTQRNYSDAAVSYEKYIRVLEITFEVPAGGLTPAVFGQSTRSKELTVVATTYWDLFRIYDTNPKYRDRMAKAMQKLADFLPYSPLCPDILKKAKAFMPAAKNPDLVKELLRLCKATSGPCFIATASFESAYDPIVIQYRLFRDSVLMQSVGGRLFVRTYYILSPFFARLLEKSPAARRVSRSLLVFLERNFVNPQI